MAKAHPQFHVILVPVRGLGVARDPTLAADKGKTLIVKVGRQGRYVGVLGAFKKIGGGFDLHYQLVPLDEYYVTPGADVRPKERRPSPARGILRRLSATRRQRTATRSSRICPASPTRPRSPSRWPTCPTSAPTPARRATRPNTRSGQDAARQGTDTLEKIAKRPSLRNFDPECVRCHTIGFDYESGYVDDKKTPESEARRLRELSRPRQRARRQPEGAEPARASVALEEGRRATLPTNVIKKMAKSPSWRIAARSRFNRPTS